MKTATSLLLLAAFGLFSVPAGAGEEYIEHPVPRAAPLTPVEEEQLPRVGGVIVFGGTSGTGLEAVRRLVERGRKVTVMARPTSDLADVQKMNVAIVVGDALNPDDVKRAYASAPFLIAVSAIGHSRGDAAPPPDFEGNKNLIDGAVDAGVERFVLLSSIGAGDSAGTEPWLSRYFIGEAIARKTRAEDYLRGSGLEYTIIRPGGLKTGPPTRRAELVEDPGRFSFIMRADLGPLVADAAMDRRAADKVYTAFDPTQQGLWPVLQSLYRLGMARLSAAMQ